MRNGSEPARNGSPRVLLVNDEPILLHLMTRRLEAAGYAVVKAEDGLQGWSRFQREAVSVVLTDLCMPHLDGIGLIRRIRSVDREIPILIASASLEPGWQTRAERAGATRCMSLAGGKAAVETWVSTALEAPGSPG